MLIMGNLKIYRGVGVSSTFLAVMQCSHQFFAVLQYSEPPNAPLTLAIMSNSSFVLQANTRQLEEESISLSDVTYDFFLCTPLNETSVTINGVAHERIQRTFH